ncbi:molecular chaperone DjlA [Jannaschia pagri]|uniref:Molecular chaperone DjlA n=1 Tax=Jannaschia pagri TaxID=2829797 RepID=A0ABQ4NHX7_9RHOB|nr:MULTISPECIES: molecular chaperone DjiA [unclassified Jannaschia]GIT89865.1 molecular chaperone DjlA [Jannaschia sp. AI_61]GIT94028.1 molecular chaperone DjlA [Jannaschia sp. AI_62]
MSIWERILDALSQLAPGERLSALFDRLRTPPERSIGFTIAVIALGAKMAKADGRVTRSEVAAFREVFTIPPAQEDNAARVFDMARTDVAGFDDYARRIAAMFDGDSMVLRDLMEGLFHIAMADGTYHPAEDDFLHQVARIFGLDDREFRSLRTRFVPGAPPDCYDVLGVTPDMPLDEIRTAWRQLVRETHPDRMMARGLPEEAVKLAEKRLVAINRAWETIQAEAA